MLETLFRVFEAIVTVALWRRYRDAQQRPDPLSVLGDIDPRRPAAPDPPITPR